jgi:hypothetical protein
LGILSACCKRKAHAAYGALLGFLIYKMNKGLPNIIKRVREAFGKAEISYA